MDRRARRVGVVVGLVLALFQAACQSRPVQPPPPEMSGEEKTPYVIGPADVLQITVWKNPELSLQQVPVRPDGRISVPLANDVQAAGMTTEELKKVLEEKLAEYVASPEVTVVVTQINSRKVYVLGEVLRPGAVPLTQDMRVLDALSVAGGFNQFANKNTVKVIRRNEDGVGVHEYRFHYDDFVEGTSDHLNMLLRNNDTIVVSD